MYLMINKLVDEIIKCDEFISYRESSLKLYDQDVMNLLSVHAMIQEDYIKSKEYEKYISNDELKQRYKEVKEKVMNNPVIMDYYNSYYRINDLLDDISLLIFKDISDDLHIERYNLRGRI